MSRFTFARSLLVATSCALALAAAGCSSKTAASAEDDITVSGTVTGQKHDAGATDTGPGPGEIGASCAKDDDCNSFACDSGLCAKSCAANADCGTGSECITTTGFNAFCHKISHPEGLGLACYMDQACPGNDTCFGDPGSTHTVCTASCKDGRDCPASMECVLDPSDASGKSNHCRPREFCSSCVTDEQCGEGQVCADHGLGARFCTKLCDPGSFECPRYADCTEVEGRNVCTHRSQTCVGDGTTCQPCSDNKCDDSGDFQCLVFRQSGESFCTPTCTAKADCGSGYNCTKVSADGTKRCVPTTNHCVGKLSELYKKGDIFEDYAMLGRVDTNGDGKLTDEEPKLIKLSDFADKQVIGITISAGWCGPCQAESKTFKATLDKYGAKAQIFQILIEDQNAGGGHIDLDFSLTWIKQLGVVGASGIDPDGTPDKWNVPGTIPLNILIDAKTRKILEKMNGTDAGGWEALFAKYIK